MAVWEEGMPPDPTTRVISHLRSVYQYVNILSSCAIANEQKAAMNGLQALTDLSASTGPTCLLEV